MKTKLLILSFAIYGLASAQNITANYTTTSVCFNNPTCFTDLSTSPTYSITTWAWDFNDGYNSTFQNPCHTYANSGTYTVTLIVTNSNGDKDTVDHPVIVNPLPMASFVSTTVCFGNITYLTDYSAIVSGSITGWSWNFGDPASGANNISNVQNPSHQFSAAGIFNVIMTVTSDSGCQSTTFLNAIVNPNPIAGFSNTNTCLNSPTIFTNNSTGTTQWYWQFGDGGISSQQNPSHTYLGYGNYISTLIVTSSGGCKDTIADTLIVYPLPIVNFISDTVCVGGITSVTDMSTIPYGNITGWSWNFGDGNTSTVQNPTHIFSNSGTFNVTLTETSNNGCINSVTIPVFVASLPNAFFSYTESGDTVFCIDLSTGGIINYDWNFGDGNTSTAQNPTHIYAFGNTYNICLGVHNQYGCFDTICHTILIASVNENYLENLFSVYPNPTSGNANVLISQLADLKMKGIEIYNMYGAKVYINEEINFQINSSSNFQIDLSSQPNGIYFVHLITDKGLAVKKVVISK